MKIKDFLHDDAIILKMDAVNSEALLKKPDRYSDLPNRVIGWDY